MAQDDPNSPWAVDVRRAPSPVGLTQQQAAIDSERDPSSPWSTDVRASQPGTISNARHAPLWETGGVSGSTQSGFDTDFYEQMFAQAEEEAARNNLGNIYARNDFTGIITYEGAKAPDGSDAKLWDVYRDGKRAGNVYEMFDRSQADLLLGQLTLDPREQLPRIFKQMADGDETALAAAVQAKAEEETANQAKYRTQADYNEAVATQQEQFEKGGTDELLTALAGFAGGMAATAWAGPWSLLGGAVGAAGALLNQDSFVSSAARIKVQQDMAGDQFGDLAGFTTGLMGWSGLAGQSMSVLTNLTHGITDAVSEGGIGDGEVAWYATDDEGNQTRPGWLTALGVVAAVGDGALQWASPVGQAAYGAQMSGYIAGRAGQLATTGGEAFSDTRGEFDSILTDDDGNFSPRSALAGFASLGIDLVQMGGRFGLRGMLRRNERALVGEGAGQTVTAGIYRFRVGADGVANWAGGSKARSTNVLTLLAPSEQLTAISARVRAQRFAAMRNKSTVTADDYYRAASQIGEGRTVWIDSLIQGVGEGYEEFAQGVLDPLSHDDRIDWRAAGEQAAVGFGMGMGMRLGLAGPRALPTGRQSTADDRAYHRAVLNMRTMFAAPDVTPEDVLSRDEWAKMSPAQKSEVADLPADKVEIYRAALAKVQAEQTADQVSGIAAIEKVTDAIRTTAAQESQSAASPTDGTYVIVPMGDADLRPDSVRASFAQIIAVLRDHHRGLREQVTFLQRDGEPDAELVALLEQASEVLAPQLEGTENEGVIGALTDLWRQARSAQEAGNRDQFRAAVQRANEFLRGLFDEGVYDEDADPALQDARQRAVTLVLGRYPEISAGSFHTLLPQISFDLSWRHQDNVLQASENIFQSLGADTDGDKLVQHARLAMDAAAFNNLRAGRNLVSEAMRSRPGADGQPRLDAEGNEIQDDPTALVLIDQYQHENDEIDILAGAHADANTAASTTAAGVIGELIESLRTRYSEVLPDTGTPAIPPTVLEPILDRLRERLVRGEHSARQDLLQELVELGGDGFWQLGLSRRSNELLWVAQRYQQMLQGFQRWNATHVATKNPLINTDVVVPTKRTTRRWEIQQTAAATEGQTLALEAEGWTLFRMFQKLHYSQYLAQVSQDPEGALPGALRDLQQAYEALGQNVTQSMLDATGTRDPIAQKVVARVRLIAQDGSAQSRSLAIIAQMAVANVRIVQGQVRADGPPITLLQLLLRQVINEDRNLHAEAITPELTERWAALDRMTEPGASGQAFVEMFGGVRLWDLLGDAAAAMGPQLTVEQFVRLYTAQGPEQKKITSQRLRAEPAYGSREGKKDLPYEWADVQASDSGEITSFRAVVESILDAGHKRITLRGQEAKDSQGRPRKAGTAGGILGQRSDLYQTRLVEMFEYVQTTLSQELGENLTVDAVARLFAENAGFARAVMNLIPDDHVNAVFKLVDGEIRTSRWVHEMFTLPPEQATMMYLRNITMAGWISKGARHGEEDGDKARTYGNLDNRLHRLMYRLANSGDGGYALREFIRRFEAATSTDEFMAYVNLELRHSSEPPYTAWINDVAEFDPDRTNAGWSNVLSGAEQREAILVLRQRAENLLAEVREDRKIVDADTKLLAGLKRAARNPNSASDAEKRVLFQLEEALRVSKDRLTAEGPNSMRVAILSAQRSFYGQAHAKGVPIAEQRSSGAFQALDDLAGFATPYERLRGSLTSVDAADFGANPQVLAHDAIDSMSATGATVAWGGLTVEQLIELWTGGSLAERKFIRAMLFPTAYERTEAGGITQQFLSGLSIQDLLDRKTYQAFHQDSPESKLTYLGLLNSQAKTLSNDGVTIVQRTINDTLLAHTTSADHQLTTSEHAGRIDQMMLQFADIARGVGDVYANLGPEALELIRTELTATLQDRLGGALMVRSAEDRAYLRDGIKMEREYALAELQERIDAAVQAGNAQEAAALGKAAESLKSRIDALLDSTEFARFRESHRIDWDDPDSIDERKKNLHAYVLRARTLATKAPQAYQAILRAYNPLRVIDGVPILSMDTAADRASWDALVDAVTAAFIEESTSVQAEGVPVPAVDWGRASSRRYVDPTYSYLLDFLDPDGPLAQAARDVHLQAFGPEQAEVNTQDLMRQIKSSILNEERLGEWTFDIARASVEANQQIDSASAGLAIPMFGIAPRRQSTLSAATERTMQTDTLDSTVSVGTIPLAALSDNNGVFSTELVTQVLDDQGEVTGTTTTSGVLAPIQLLNGRFARGARLMRGDQEVANLWTSRLGRTDLDRPAVTNSGFRAITIKQLRHAAESQLPAGVDPTELRVEIDYLHPDSQPARAGYYNSIFYDGVLGETNADTARSLIASLWFSNDGISPTGEVVALQSTKTGTPAVRFGKAFSSQTRRDIEKNFLTDFSGMLMEKARRMIELDLGDGPLPHTSFSGVLKDMKMHHFVRGRRGGQMELWTSEQVIAWQRAHPNQKLTDVLEGAELWKPSPAVLRTMLGETGDQGARGAVMVGYDPDPRAIKPYQGVTDEMLARVPDWDKSTDIFAATAAHHSFQTRLRLRPTLDDQTLLRYDQGQMYLDALRQKIHEARARSWESGRAESSAQSMLERAQEALKSETPGLSLVAAGFPFLTTLLGTDKSIATMILRDYSNATKLTGREAGWIIRENHGEKAPDLASSVVTPVSLDPTEKHFTEPRLENQIAPGDLAVVELESFEPGRPRLEDQFKLAQRRLRALAAHSPVIALTHAQGARELRVHSGEFLESLGYERLAGSRHVYVPRRHGSQAMTRAARLSTLLETHTETAQNLVTVFLAGPNSPLSMAENGAYFVSRNPQRTVALPVSLVPINAYGGFGRPAGREQVESIKTQVEYILDDTVGGRSKFSHLLKMSGIVDASGAADLRAPKATELRRALQRYLDNAGDDGLPVVDSRFGTGDIIPLVNRKGQILFYRHGMRPPAEIESQLSAQEVTDGGGAGLAIYRPDPLPAATTYTGTVVSFDVHSQYGLTVQLRVPLQHLGNKIQVEGLGMKFLQTPAGDKIYLPSHDLFSNGVGIDLISDLATSLQKESTGGLVNNFRNAFAYFGVDFVPELTQFFYDQDYYAMSPQERTVAHGLVTQLLQQIHRSSGDVPAGAVQEMMRLTSMGKQVEDVLRSITLPGVKTSWLDTITAVSPVETMTPAQRIGRAAVLYMLMPQAQPHHILRAGGVNSSADVRVDGSSTVYMPRIFTEVFDRTEPGDPLRTLLFQKLNAQIDNTQARGIGKFADTVPDPDDPSKTMRRGKQWYWLQDDFTFSMRNADGRQIDGTLQFGKANSSGDNPVMDGQAAVRNDSQNWSRHSIAIAYESIGARTAARKELERTERFARLQDGVLRGSLWEVLNQYTIDHSAPQFLRERPGEMVRRRMAYEAVAGYRVEIDRSEWSEEERSLYENRRTDVAQLFGLAAPQAGTLDFWVRQMLGIYASDTDPGKIGFEWAMETLGELEWNARHHLLPTAGAEVPQIHLYDLVLLHEANKKAGARWYLETGPGTGVRVESWEGWVQTALGTAHTEHQIFDPRYLLATDGLMHTFQDALDSLVSLPVSRDMLVNAQMMEPSTDRLIQSLDPNTDLLGQDPVVLEVTQTALADVMNAELVSGNFRQRQAPSTVLSQRRAQRLKWRKEHGAPIPLDVTMKDLRAQGVNFIDDSTVTHPLMRILTNLRAGNALLNPLLWMSAIPEMAHRSLLDEATNLIMGQATGGLGQAAARAGAQVGVSLRYTPAEIERLQRLYAELGARTDFKGMLYKELAYQLPRLKNAGRLERWTHRYAQFGSRWQDPTYGMPGTVLARRYMEKALEDLASSGSVISVDQLAAHLHRDPKWLQKHHPEAHRSALNTIASVRSLRPTPISLMLRGIYEPATQSSRRTVNMLGHLTRIPLMFAGYMTNVMVTFTGMQGFSNMAAMFMQGRDKKFIGRIQAAIRGEKLTDKDSTIDMSEALDGIDLAKMFIQGGITHTGLFTLGLMAQGLGLSGEDDEERRRRRASQTTGGQFLYDPRRIQNDFRNSEAIFFDSIPFFSALFKIDGGDENGEGARSMANLPWIMRQFVSPIIGMERFFDTGDPQQIVWGFQDALGAMPLFNSSSWDSATQMFNELMANADDAAKRGTPQDLAESMGFMISAMGTMERMLFENSFVNMVYVGQDAYDRDPWKRPQIDSDGDVQYDLLGNPRTTQAMSRFLDEETGEVRMGYTNRGWMDATVRQLTENRLGLATLMSLTTGLASGESYFRNSMVVKQRTLEKPVLSQEEAEGLVLSIMDAESYGRSAEGSLSKTGEPIELLTADGARAVFQGLYAGTVSFGSPALEGLYIDLDTRQAIQDKWMAELIAQGLEAGLDQEAAESWMWDVWLGQGDSPYGVGISDILWANEPGEMIPYTPQVRYNQLNTTYIMGPSGYPYATGATRDGIHNLFGLLPSRYYLAADTGLGVDERLNTVDDVLRLNTGMRGLQRLEENWYVPTDEEIGKRIEESLGRLGDNLEDVLKDRLPGYSRGYGSGGSGGYGGYSSVFIPRYGGMALRLNEPRRVRMAYADDLYSINTSNPYTRRANLRRERFASQRGRLNQWQ